MQLSDFNGSNCELLSFAEFIFKFNKITCCWWWGFNQTDQQKINFHFSKSISKSIFKWLLFSSIFSFKNVCKSAIESCSNFLRKNILTQFIQTLSKL